MTDDPPTTTTFATVAAVATVAATIRELDGDAFAEAIPGLAALLVDAVDGGASVNFVAGVTAEEAAAWWHERIDQVRDGVTSAMVAVDGEVVVGSVLLMRSTNPNSPHRAEIGKMLVLRS
ncbi:MAG: GNAT family N-acetyltransferase, partial [Candidatus Limnocylindrales bacterium]